MKKSSPLVLMLTPESCSNGKDVTTNSGFYVIG